MKIKHEQIDEKPKFDGFKLHEAILSELVKGDVITALHNGVEIFRCEVLHGVNTVARVLLLDKGNKISISEQQQEILDQINELKAQYDQLKGE